jgi:diguanylate cyclase (GGDEF)-like protein/PAS domain S-box-containing protein
MTPFPSDPLRPQERKEVPDRAQDLLGRLEQLQREVHEERLARQAAERKLEDFMGEMESTNRQIEAAIEFANQMALKAQVANIELNQIFNTTADSIWVIGKDFTVLQINETFLKMLRKNLDETLGKKCHDVFSSEACAGQQCLVSRLSQGEKRIEYDIQKECADGVTRSFIVTATPFCGPDGEVIGIVEVYKDISDRKRAEEALQKANRELQRLAALDGLTQIPNRRGFDERLDMEWKRSRREQNLISLIMGDVDFFKLYNDNYGHHLGDECLKAVAACINDTLLRPADLAARYGGEEFAIILPQTSAQGALCVAEKIRQRVEALRIQHASSSFHFVTLSLGVATMVPSQHNSPEALIELADRSMYEAKNAGRNRVSSLAG